MKILLLGGTGAMGVHLTNILVERGEQVFVTTRKARISASPLLTYVEGNAQEEHFFAEVLRQEEWDAVVDFMVYNTATFKSRYATLLHATRQYLFISSSRVYADSKEPLTETSARLLDASDDKTFLSTDEYSLAKARQENILFDANSSNWTIIRPYITYGEYRLQLGTLEKELWLYRVLKGRSILFCAEMCGRLTTLTYGYDVALGIAALIGKNEALGQAYHITQPKPILWADVLAVYRSVLAKYLGADPKVKLVPLTQFLNVQNARYQVYYDRMYHRTFSTYKLENQLNISQFTSPEEGLENCLKAFLRAPNFGTISWWSEGQMDKLTGEYTPLREIQGGKGKILYLVARFLPPRITNWLWTFITQRRRTIRY